MRYLVGFCILILLSCKSDKTAVPENSLEAYIQELNQPVSTNLIACAASIPNSSGAMENSIFFLPVTGAHSFKYFETPNIQDNPDDLTVYEEVELSLDPVFNYLKKFTQGPIEEEKWGKVTYVVGDSLHICNAIRLKQPIKPTEINSVYLQINQLENDEIRFSWDDGLYDDNTIYFQVVSDDTGNLITGTYTYDKYFTFFDPSNVVLNINPDNDSPKLETGRTYRFTLMAVSIDNWVNLIINEEFQY